VEGGHQGGEGTKGEEEEESPRPPTIQSCLWVGVGRDCADFGGLGWVHYSTENLASELSA